MALWPSVRCHSTVAALEGNVRAGGLDICGGNYLLFLTSMYHFCLFGEIFPGRLYFKLDIFSFHFLGSKTAKTQLVKRAKSDKNN